MLDTASEMIKPYRGWLLAAAGRMTAGDEVEDLAQEGWIAMWKAYRSWVQTKGPLDWWLKYNAINKMKTAISRDRGLSVRGRSGPGVAAASIRINTFDNLDETNHPASLDDNLEDAYHKGEINRAIQTLSPKEREFVVKKYYQDATYKDLSRYSFRLKTSATTKLRNQLQHLRDYI